MASLVSNLRLASRLSTQISKTLLAKGRNGPQYMNVRGYPQITAFSENEGKTTVTILNDEEDAPLMINSYSLGGFRLNNDIMTVGPIAVFPKTVLSWNISGIEDVNADSLALFYMLEPRLDVLLLGLGDDASAATIDFVRSIKRKGINIECFPTAVACSTFNFLNTEGRSVAAALIPPQTLAFTDRDVYSTKFKRRELYLYDETLELPDKEEVYPIDESLKSSVPKLKDPRDKE